MCMDDSNPAVAIAAVRSMEAFLSPLAETLEEAEGRMQGLSWLDYQVILPVVRVCRRCWFVYENLA